MNIKQYKSIDIETELIKQNYFNNYKFNEYKEKLGKIFLLWKLQINNLNH